MDAAESSLVIKLNVCRSRRLCYWTVFYRNENNKLCTNLFWFERFVKHKHLNFDASNFVKKLVRI